MSDFISPTVIAYFKSMRVAAGTPELDSPRQLRRDVHPIVAQQSHLPGFDVYNKRLQNINFNLDGIRNRIAEEEKTTNSNSDEKVDDTDDDWSDSEVGEDRCSSEPQIRVRIDDYYTRVGWSTADQSVRGNEGDGAWARLDDAVWDGSRSKDTLVLITTPQATRC